MPDYFAIFAVWITLEVAIMFSHKYEKRHLALFTKTLFEKYVTDHGYSLASLDKHRIQILQNDLPQVFYKIESKVKSSSAVLYFSELKARGLLVQEGNYYKFTKEGFDFAYACTHPIKGFHFKHWKWLYGVFFIGLLTVLATLLAGALASPICSLLVKATSN